MKSTANELSSLSPTVSDDILVQVLKMKRQSVREEASSTGRGERFAPDPRNPAAMVAVKAVICLYGAFSSSRGSLRELWTRRMLGR